MQENPWGSMKNQLYCDPTHGMMLFENWAWWCIPIIPAHGRERKKSQELKASLCNLCYRRKGKAGRRRKKRKRKKKEAGEEVA